jgi:hypothetical protein
MLKSLRVIASASFSHILSSRSHVEIPADIASASSSEIQKSCSLAESSHQVLALEFLQSSSSCGSSCYPFRYYVCLIFKSSSRCHLEIPSAITSNFEKYNALRQTVCFSNKKITTPMLLYEVTDKKITTPMIYGNDLMT